TAADQTSKAIFENNRNSDKNLLDYFKFHKKIQGIIFMSAALVSTAADIQYTRSKLFTENKLCDSGIPHLILRPDMIYSSDEKKMLEYVGMIKKGFAPIVGNGLYLRSPTHLSDVLVIFQKAIEQDLFTNKVYEVGSPLPLSQNEILEK